MMNKRLLSAYVLSMAVVCSGVQAGTIAGGADHSIALKSDGTVWTWGDNSHGELGNASSGPGTGTDVPVQVSGLSGIVAVAAGTNFSVALDDAGSVWTWGDDAAGQLGDGTAGAGRPTPYEVTAISNVSMIAAGQDFVLVRKSDNTLWAWGGNGSGQLGIDSTSGSATAVQVKDTAGTGTLGDVLFMTAGAQHGLAVSGSGSVYAWGGNGSGQIGLGNTTTPQKLPKAVLGIGGTGTLGGVRSVAAGQASSYAVLTDGTAVAWGANGNGALGDGSSTQRTTPVVIVGNGGSGALGGIDEIAATASGALALKADGSVWTWGLGGNGQRGDASTGATQTSPARVKDTPGTGYLADVVAIGAGASHGLAVTSDGGAWAWGLNSSGQLGDDSTTQRTTPVPVDGDDFTSRTKTPSFSPGGGQYGATQSVGISSATSGATVRYTVGTSPQDPTTSDPAATANVDITESTTVKAKAWASGKARSDTAQATYVLKVPTPTIEPVTGSYGTPQAVIITGASGSETRYTTDGGDPTPGSTLYTGSFQVATGTTVKARSFRTGWTTSDLATSVLSFNYGTLAAPTLTPPSGPFSAPQNVGMTASSGAEIHYTQDGTTPSTSSPTYSSPVTVDTSLTVKARAFHSDWTASGTTIGVYSIIPRDVAAGANHSLVRDTAGAVWSWGGNGRGQLGDGTTNQRVLPAQLASPMGVVLIAAGEEHTLALLSDGTVRSWGRNDNGQLGDGSTTQRTLPVTVSGLSDIVAIAAGARHSLALDRQGRLWAWGQNSNGQIGDGTTTQRNSPVQVTSLTGVTAIAAGMYHNLAVVGANTVWAWGNGGEGRLGDGSTTQRNSPVQTGSLTNVVAVSAGEAHSLALKADGAVSSWGRNYWGHLGDSSTTQRNSPVSVSGLSGVVAIAAGRNRGFALGTDGQVRGWGGNGQGQLGDGGVNHRTSPVLLPGLTDIVRIAAGYEHSLAVASDGSVYAWGLNSNGQLGDGTTTDRATAVKVAEAGLAWRAATPTASPSGGNFTSNQNVTLQTQTSGALIYYTLSGAEPTTSDASVSPGGVVQVTTSLTLKAKAFKSGMPPSATASFAFVLTVPNPSLNPGGNTYTSPPTVSVNCNGGTGTVYYTRTNVDPTTSDSTIACGGSLSVDYVQTIKLRSYKTGWNPSGVVSGNYSMTVATPTLSPTGGALGSVVPIVISTTTPGAVIHYTTDGSDPTETDPTIASGTGLSLPWSATLKARGWRQNWITSGIVSATYLLSLGTVAAPTFDVTAGTYPSGKVVTLSSATAGALIHYTTDGTEPGPDSRVYGAPLSIDATATVKAKALKQDWTPSATSSAAYVIDDGRAAAPALTVPSGSYASRREVVLSSSTPGAVIHYTTNGADPTASDASVSSGGTVTVDRTLVLKARTIASGYPDSAFVRADYLITGTLAAGNSHTLMVKGDGTLWAWGRNNEGQLGDGTTTTRFSPVQVMTGVQAVAAGEYHTVILKADGTVWTVGRNGDGQLGDGATSNRSAPYQVPGLSGMIAVGAGHYHSLAVRGSDGVVFAWGRNNQGQLGDNSTTQRTSPVQVSGLSSVMAVAGGNAHSLALKADRTVWGWGNNGGGQLGDGTLNQRNTPVAATGLGGVRQIGAGDQQSSALRTDGMRSGRLWVWGFTNNGQLGLGQDLTIYYTKPTGQLDGLSTFGMGRAESHAAALDGSEVGWGYNGNCPLGDGTGDRRLYPVFIPGLRDIATVSFGASHGMALRADGALWGWGQNLDGRLGIGVASSNNCMPFAITGVSSASNSWANQDTDGDGLTNAAESRYGSDPLDADSNDDGMSDGAAVAAGRNPATHDTDGDGLGNSVELKLGTDPFNSDTDGDGVIDSADAFPLDATKSSTSPDAGDHTAPVVTLTAPTGATLIP